MLIEEDNWQFDVDTSRGRNMESDLSVKLKFDVPCNCEEGWKSHFIVSCENVKIDENGVVLKKEDDDEAPQRLNCFCGKKYDLLKFENIHDAIIMRDDCKNKDDIVEFG